MTGAHSSDVVDSDAAALSRRLRAATASLHGRAERSGVVADLLRGHGSTAGYALLLRNLLPGYRALEAALGRRRAAAPWLAFFATPAFARAAAIEADLAALSGPAWATRLPLLPAGLRYAHRVSDAATEDGRLVAHAYVRVLGDLSGGQVLARVLARSLGLEPAALRSLAFPDVPDLAAALARRRAAMDAACPHFASADATVREARVAFRLNIALAEAVRTAAAGPDSPPSL